MKVSFGEGVAAMEYVPEREDDISEEALLIGFHELSVPPAAAERSPQEESPRSTLFSNDASFCWKSRCHFL